MSLVRQIIETFVRGWFPTKSQVVATSQRDNRKTKGTFLIVKVTGGDGLSEHKGQWTEHQGECTRYKASQYVSMLSACIAEMTGRGKGTQITLN